MPQSLARFMTNSPNHVPSRHSSFYRFEQSITPRHRRGRLGVALTAALCALVALSASAQNSPPKRGAATPCAPSDGLSYVCGPVASEDLVRLPDSRWLIASGLNVGAPAHLYLIDAHRKRATIAFPPETVTPPPQSPSKMGCDGPPDLQRMSLDGLALRPGAARRHILYAANHGDRMAIEVFAIDARGARPRLRWADCAMLPAKTLPNAVATLPGDGLLVISFYDPTEPQSWARMARGEVTGRILQWHPGRGFTAVANGATSGGNGLASSADGRLVYASSWSARRLVVLSLTDASRKEIALDFMPDNIHRLANGSLLVAGQRTTVAAIHACTGPQCPQPWVIAHVEPQGGTVTELLSGPGTTAINYACGAVAISGTLFVTARGAQRIAYRDVPGAAYLN